jgi:hypothetical protein
MTWGGGQTGPETGVGGLNRANLRRIEASEEEMTREANEIRRNEPDENDDKSIKDGYRRDFINKLTLIMIIAFVFGLIIFVRVFVAH